MTKMTAPFIYATTFYDLFFRTTITMILKHRQVCMDYYPGLTLTYLVQCQKSFPGCLNGDKLLQSHLMEKKILIANGQSNRRSNFMKTIEQNMRLSAPDPVECIRQLFSNIVFSETTRPIKVNLLWSLPGKGGGTA